MNERVRRPYEHEEFLQELGGPSSKKEKPFDSLKSVLLFAAALASHRDQERCPFSKSGEKIPFSYFSSDFEKSFIASLALQDTKDVTILHPSRLADQIEIFEEMANAGLNLMKVGVSSSSSIDAYLLGEVSGASEDAPSIIDELFAFS
ncbi:MAG: DNA phosphorothioation-associated protein 4 [Alcanivoracaceae bacterium]|nr:DNA phosphorothioation-associated protein 4 [Alcanivoracaceae bacterium]